MRNETLKFKGYRLLRMVVVCIFIILCFCISPLYGAGGQYLGMSTLLFGGDPAQKIDIVFLGDGFTNNQQGKFNTKVDMVVNEFLASHPFFALRSAFNIHRVNVSSPESGTDIPATCGGNPTGYTQQNRQTAMDTGFCGAGNGSVFRGVSSSNHNLAFGFANNAPDDDFVVVLVNHSQRGGSATGNICYFTLSDDFEEVCIHELGHSIFDLADEYDYDGPENHTGTVEPGRANITIERNRGNLKWGDLVLASTAIPTHLKSNCSQRRVTVPHPIDLVGTYEGAGYCSCGIFRPQPNCRMRVSDQHFCAVCRREIIRELSARLGLDRIVTFSDLLIRKDHEPWYKGKADIYMHYDLRVNAEEISGRWPASGESYFKEGQQKPLNVTAGIIPEPAMGTSAAIETRVREEDWPDSDDTLRSDAVEYLPPSGTFSVDRQDYRLRGNVRPATLRVLLDTLHMKDLGFLGLIGLNRVYVRYTISNGTDSIQGRWPATGKVTMSNESTRIMRALAGALPRPATGHNLNVNIRIYRTVNFFLNFSETINFSFGGGNGYGTQNRVHVQDGSNFRIVISVAGNP